MEESSFTFSGADFQDLDVRDYLGESILHKAVIMGELEVVQELVQLGVELNFQGELVYTPLHIAASFGRLEMVKILIVGKAHIDSLDERSMTPLFNAIMSNRLGIARHLISHGANLDHMDCQGRKPIEFARPGSRMDSLIKSAIEITSQNSPEQVRLQFQDENPAYESQHSISKSLERLSWFDKKQVIPNSKQTRSENLTDFLQHMQRQGSPFAGEELRDLNVRNCARESLLHHAVAMREEEVVGELIELGVEANCFDDAGNTPLHLAAERGDKDVMEILLSGNADLESQDHNNMTPIFRAVSKATSRGVNALIELGANTHHVDIQGKRPIDYAIPGSRIELLLRDASINNKK
ncbi:MAG: ankyrin repeat domain-containing protein [Pirellula sp.]|jgi:ankyrin repeat protein